MSTTLDSALVAELTGQVSGPVLEPQDAGYDAARAVHNGLIDRRPALIVRCRTTTDVVAALAFAARAGLEVSVRGGGHNVTGRAVTEGGVMIDLAEMKGIAIDPGRATATAEGGVIWGELNDAAAGHGLAVTGGAVSGIGIAGYTLGGGLGWLMAKYGLAADNLLAVVFAGLVHAPDGSGAKLAALVVFHTGDPVEAERDLEPFKTWGSPLVVDVGPMPYPVMNTLLDAGFPAGSLNYWLSSFTRRLPDELIDIAVERFAGVPSPMSAILLEQFHGAVTRVGATETAVPHRDKGWNLLIPSVWTDPADNEANIARSRETFAAMRPHFASGRWLNYLGDDQAEEAIRAAYGPNYDRLVEVKRRYDPDNVFHLNHNIAP